MKSFTVWALFAFALQFAPHRSYAQAPDSCLKLWCKDWEEISEYTICRNPDSVLVDSCEGSATYLQFYANRWFGLTFEEEYFGLPSYPRDSIIEVDWQNISSVTVKETMFMISSTYGAITLRKRYPDIVDESNRASRMYLLKFHRYASTDSIVHWLKTAGIEAEFRSEPAIQLSVSGSDAEVLSVWPNPTRQILNITVDDNRTLSFVLYDNAGRASNMDAVRNGQTYVIDVSALISGVYVIIDSQGRQHRFIRK